MGPRVTFALLFVTVVLAKKGGSSSHSTGGGTSSSSGPGSSSFSFSSDGGSALYFIWTSAMLSEFILAIIYGVFTLVGGGYWLSKRYNPAMTAVGLKALMWSTWGNWSLSRIVYLLATCWTGRYAYWLADYTVYLLEITETSFARSALENIATGGWMFILLAHTFTVWKTAGAEIDRPSRGHIFFYTTLSFLTLASIFGGIVRPAMMGASGNANTPAGFKNIDGVQVIFTLFALVSACSLLLTVRFTRIMTHISDESRLFDPLRWVLLVAVPLWILTEFVRFVLAVVMLTRLPLPTLLVFEPSLLLFGIACLTTIALLPFTAFNMKESKDFEA